MAIHCLHFAKKPYGKEVDDGGGEMKALARHDFLPIIAMVLLPPLNTEKKSRLLTCMYVRMHACNPSHFKTTATPWPDVNTLPQSPPS